MVVPALRDALPRALATDAQLGELRHDPLLELSGLLVLGADLGLGDRDALEPGMPRQPLARLASAGVADQHGAQQRLRLARNVRGHRELAAEDVPRELLLGVAHEGEPG